MPKISRFSPYGDFWSRALRWAARHTPAFLEPIFIGPMTVFFFLIAPKQRRAIQRNLAVLLPGSSKAMNVFRSMRVFWNFAWSIADASHVKDGQRIISWEIIGDPQFQSLQENPAGILILTAHMGNYDIAAPVFSHKFHRKLHIVRLPEKDAALQAFMEETRDKQQGASYQIHYNRPGNMLAIELATALSAGDAVAIQGDRVMGDVTSIEAPFDANHSLKLPKGPFVLAMASRAPLLPLFIIRLGWRKYQVLIRPVHSQPPDIRDRAAAMEHHVSRWTQTLRKVTQEHWEQWFVLEDAFVAASNEPPLPLPAEPEPAKEILPRDASMPAKGTTMALSATSTALYTTFVYQLLHRNLSSPVAVLLTYPFIFICLLLCLIMLSTLHGLPLLRKIAPHTFQLAVHLCFMTGIIWSWIQ